MPLPRHATTTRRVLIVDDNQEALFSLQEGMAKYGRHFEILIAGDGKVAVQKLSASSIDLIVTDMKMPRMDGLALLKHVQARYADIPVIIMSGFSTPEMERLARESGAAEFIEKPFKISYLHDRIVAILNQQADGGTLHKVTASMFLQLIEMEQRTCTLRLQSEATGQRGALFFHRGQLLDARVDELREEAAARKIFSWDEVSLSIQLSCPVTRGRIENDLQYILFEAMRQKDESRAPEDAGRSRQASPAPDTPSVTQVPVVLTETLRRALSGWHGVDRIYSDTAARDLLQCFNDTGRSLSAGKLAFAFVRCGDGGGRVLVPDGAQTAIALSTACPREKLFQELMRRLHGAFGENADERANAPKI